MNEFVIQQNDYLEQNIKAFYHTSYTGMGHSGNPDYINTLKNTFNNFSPYQLQGAAQELKNVLDQDLVNIFNQLKFSSLTVCVIPRAKDVNSYSADQMLFKSTVSTVVNELDGLCNGVNYITRHTDTKTTHLQRPIENGQITQYDNSGDMPYAGITSETCNISSNVSGKDIILIDDIYTNNVNIDEDAIQALLDNGANSVTFYAIGYTV